MITYNSVHTHTQAHMSYIQIGDDYDSVWGEHRPKLIIVDESGLKPLRFWDVLTFEKVRRAAGTCGRKENRLK